MASNKKPTKRLFVGGLPYRFSEGQLLSLFVPEGKVIDVRIIHNKWGKSRGMGYVEFEKLDDAVRAKTKLHNFHIAEDRTIIVDYAMEDPLKTEEGQKRHFEAEQKRNFKKKTSFEYSTQKPQEQTEKRKDFKHIRQSVFNSRNFGSRVGAKFAKKTKRK